MSVVSLPGGRAGALEDYARLKLQLADVVRTLLQLGEKSRNALTIQECRQLLGRLAEDRFNLAIVGQFSRGKSSLMNALLGAEELPTGALPLTSVVTTVSYGERERVLVQRQGWNAPQEIPLGQLAEYVTQDGNPGNEKQVTRAEIQLPNELLRLGVHFIDTPGMASLVEANTRATRQFLPQADAAILVTSFESPLTEAEARFAAEVAEHAQAVFVVVNKQDLVAASEREPVREAVAAALRFPRPSEVFTLSAREALRAKLGRSAAGIEASGLPPLETRLAQYLRHDKARDLLLRAAARAADIARQHRLTLQIAQRGRSPDEAARIRWRLEEQLSRLAREREVLARQLGERLRRDFSSACERRLGLGDEALAEQLAASVRAGTAPGETTPAPAWDGLLQRTFNRVLAAWLASRREALDNIFLETMRPEAEALDRLAAEIAAVPAGVLGGDAEPVFDTTMPPAHSMPLRLPEIRLAPADDRAPWWHVSLPSGRLREFTIRRWLRGLPQWTDLYRDAVRSLLRDAVAVWTDNLNRELAGQIAAAGAQVRGWLDQPPEPADEAAVERVLEQLREFSAAAANLGGDASAVALSAAGGAAAARAAPRAAPCPICLRLERVVMDGLARLQYELNVNEVDRRRHAAHAGFCPLHTWQYEAVASPQGICAAYPDLLRGLAGRLQGLVARVNTAAALAAGVRELLPRPETCPACQWMAAAEAAAARDLVRAATHGGENADAGLCLPHLVSVLGMDPELPAAWVERAADGLERLAEDMRNYAMKHDAIRRQLATGSERHAANGGLARLVGRRAVVAPWRCE